MKFYYNGKLVRTSKTHEYHYAIINENGGLWSCHGTLEAAQKEFRKPISETEQAISNYRKAIEALNGGKSFYICKSGRYEHKVSLRGKDFMGRDYSKVETWENFIENDLKRIEAYNTRKIVELTQEA